MYAGRYYRGITQSSIVSPVTIQEENTIEIQHHRLEGFDCLEDRQAMPFQGQRIKDEFVKVWNEAKTTPVPTFEVWTEADEQALVKLEETVELEGAIALEDADSGRLAHQRQHECMASAADMSTEQLAALEQMIAATKGRVSIG
jgi:predicted HAD superfamily Cof-like phosphohydrolase